MGSYGIGQGLNEGVKTATQALLSATELKQRQKQFDAQQNFRYNYLASMQGWKTGMAGDDTDEARPAPSVSFPTPAEPTEQQVGRFTVPGMPKRFLIPAMQQRVDNDFHNRYLVAKFGFDDKNEAVDLNALAQPKEQQVGRFTVPGLRTSQPMAAPRMSPAQALIGQPFRRRFRY